jgi:hypothetical protein
MSLRETNRKPKIQKLVMLSMTAIFCLFSSSIAAAFAVPSVTPASFNFGNVAINQPSAVETFTLKNNEATAISAISVALTSAGATNPYAIDPSTTCGNTVTTLAPSGTCIVGVTITPTATGVQPVGTLKITNSVNALSVTLKGTGVNPVVLSPTSLTFAAQFLGTMSAYKPVLITNEQLVPLPITSPSISGPDAGDFQLGTSSCPFSPPNSLPAAPPQLRCSPRRISPQVASSTTCTSGMAHPICTTWAGTGYQGRIYISTRSKAAQDIRGL